MVRQTSRMDWLQAKILATFKDKDEAREKVSKAILWGLPLSKWNYGRPGGRTGAPVKGGKTCTRRWEDEAGNQIQLRAADASEAVFEVRYLSVEGHGPPSLEQRQEEEQASPDERAGTPKPSPQPSPSARNRAARRDSNRTPTPTPAPAPAPTEQGARERSQDAAVENEEPTGAASGADSVRTVDQAVTVAGASAAPSHYPPTRVTMCTCLSVVAVHPNMCGW